MVKVGLIAFANDGGLGAQSRRLAEMLNPDRVLVINSTAISPNQQLHYDWYKKYEMFTASFPPSNVQIDAFLQNLTHIFVVENPYNFYLVWACEKKGIKLFVQSNYEFCENLDKPYLPIPYKFLMPSYWKLEEMKRLFGEDKVMYLPPPLNYNEFTEVRNVNLLRKGKPRFLHIIGTVASNDRNGTLDLLEAIKLTKTDFELVIKTQHQLDVSYFLDDKRVKYEIGNVGKNSDLYKNFDALILPRRYGGLSLTTCEALMSGMPTIMTDISPNNKWLPKKWLVKSRKKGAMRGRSVFDVYSANHSVLAQRIDWMANMQPKYWKIEKQEAYNLALDNFAEAFLKPQYQKLLV